MGRGDERTAGQGGETGNQSVDMGSPRTRPAQLGAFGQVTEPLWDCARVCGERLPASPGVRETK